MNLNEYQEKALETAIYSEDKKIFYPAFGLAGEVGEVVEHIKKMYRKDINLKDLDSEKVELLKKELGDVLWYISVLSNDLGFKLQDVADLNLEKLSSRKDRGVLHEEGDNR